MFYFYIDGIPNSS